MDHLTATCIAARAAGMSYGRYVAMMHERDPTPQKPAGKKKAERYRKSTGLVKTCAICGARFETASHSRKYCSDKCAKKSERASYKRWSDRQRKGE